MSNIEFMIREMELAVAAMHKHFGLAYAGVPGVLSQHEATFRHTCLTEEIEELGQAASIADQFDALLDLLIFTLGTLDRLGVPSVANKISQATAKSVWSPESVFLNTQLIRDNATKYADCYIESESLPRQVDALIHLAAVAITALSDMNVSVMGGFNAVMSANMQKRVALDGNESKRGFKLDLVKPEGWMAPDLSIFISKIPVGEKFDTDKARFDLLDFRFIEGIAEVLTIGAEKYSANNWQLVKNPESRYFAALMRHISAHARGELVDVETGKAHLVLAATNLMFLNYFMETKNVIK